MSMEDTRKQGHAIVIIDSPFKPVFIFNLSILLTELTLMHLMIRLLWSSLRLTKPKKLDIFIIIGIFNVFEVLHIYV